MTPILRILLFTTLAISLSACLNADGPRPTDTGPATALDDPNAPEIDRMEQALRAVLTNPEFTLEKTETELVITLPGALAFAPGSVALLNTLQSDLSAIASAMNEFPASALAVVGHTDNSGAASMNQQLSAERAESVRAGLVSYGVAASRLSAIGRGESDPKATNLNEAGRALNNRIEIIITPAS